MALTRRRSRAGSKQATGTGGAGGAGLAAAVGPAALQVTPRHIVVGDHDAATFAVVGYPAEVGPAWLEPLLAYPGRIELAVHIDPVPTPVAAAQLRRQRARFESTRRLDAERGRLGDPADDAADLADRIARGAAKLFRAGIYLTVHARTEQELAEACAQARAAAGSTLLDLVPATWRHHTGWDLHPSARRGRAGHAAHLRHRRAGRRVPAGLRRPARPAARAGPGARRRALRGEHHHARDRLVGPLVAGQPQHGCWPGPGRASPTWSNSSCCAPSTRACTPP
jgi:hypothetical protein